MDVTSFGSNTVTATYTVPTNTFPFSDNVEEQADTVKWAWASPWGRTNEKAHSGQFSWTDSPGSGYEPNTNTALSMFANLSGSNSPVLLFWHIYNLEDNLDFGYVEVSTDG